MPAEVIVAPKELKKALTYPEQLERLKARGLQVKDEAFALHCLAEYNYYRLSIYWRRFTSTTDHDNFLPDTTFEQIWQLYDFDRKLRLLIVEACKRIEISARSRWAYELGHAHGPQAYENPAVFNSITAHTKLLAWFDERFEESKELFAIHYKSQHCPRPEIWIAIALLDFGRFCRFYTTTKEAKLRKQIAAHYQLPEEFFSSLLTHTHYLRNLCAHHSRLWNRKLKRKLKLPQKKPEAIVQNLNHDSENRLYNSFVFLIHCVQLIEPRGNWPNRLRKLLDTLPPELLPDMGFPFDWQQRPIWNLGN